MFYSDTIYNQFLLILIIKRPQIERFYLKNLLFHKTQSFTVPFLDQDNLDNSAPFLEPKEEELNSLYYILVFNNIIHLIDV